MSKRKPEFMGQEINIWDVGTAIFIAGCWTTMFMGLPWTMYACLAAVMLCTWLSVRLDHKKQADKKRGWGGWR
jgi:hypothetical protein